ncbi:MAG: ankyrin repeat domain-containing protein, partial [Pseudomonadales bacterium]|nr:ankyrin repeat domain-containing protein [Pseudomonadales bacterium]
MTESVLKDQSDAKDYDILLLVIILFEHFCFAHDFLRGKFMYPYYLDDSILKIGWIWRVLFKLKFKSRRLAITSKRQIAKTTWKADRQCRDLFLAIEGKNVDWLKELLDGGECPGGVVRQGYHETMTPLAYACKVGFEKGVEILLDAGADPEGN